MESKYKKDIEKRIRKLSIFKDNRRLSTDWDTLNCLLSKIEGYNQAIKELNSQIKPNAN